jgi:hypothetical protein
MKTMLSPIPVNSVVNQPLISCPTTVIQTPDPRVPTVTRIKSRDSQDPKNNHLLREYNHSCYIVNVLFLTWWLCCSCLVGWSETTQKYHMSLNQTDKRGTTFTSFVFWNISLWIGIQSLDLIRERIHFSSAIYFSLFWLFQRDSYDFLESVVSLWLHSLSFVRSSRNCKSRYTQGTNNSK